MVGEQVDAYGMAFADQAALAVNPDFRAKVTMAMIVAAVDISAEAPGDDPAVALRRAELAFLVLQRPTDFIDRFAFVVASNVAISASSNDGDIQYTVNSVWDHLAGTRVSIPF